MKMQLLRVRMSLSLELIEIFAADGGTVDKYWKMMVPYLKMPRRTMRDVVHSV
jgi:hypothetical protein